MTRADIQKRIVLISDGVPFKLGNMTIRTTDSGLLVATGYTNTIHFENISKSTVLRELENLKISFTDLCEDFHELEDLVKRRNQAIEFHMAYDDAGKTSISLCSEINEKVQWYIQC